MNWVEEIAESVKKGERVTTTVRDLLNRFGAGRRGRHIVADIQRALDQVELTTWPQFDEAYIDGEIEFRIIPTESADAEPDHDPVPRIGQLDAANRPPVVVGRDEGIDKAVSLMMLRNFSQLPVMQGNRNVDGFVSWKTIGAARARGSTPTYVRDAMDNPEIVDANTPLFETIERIARHDFVLVRGSGQIKGLVTTFDVSLQFHELSRPFLLISQIEGHVRSLIGKNFTVEELAVARDPNDEDRVVQSVVDLTFGEYLRLLDNDERWPKLGLALDRKTMMDRLDTVRLIRNEIMHFSPDPLDEVDLGLLTETSRCLAELIR